MGMWDSKTLNRSGLAIAGRWADAFWVLGLTVAAMVLFTVQLGNVALRDWDEGIVAQVARDIWRSQVGGGPDSWTWLYPTIAGVPYLNKPTLVHWLIAQSYAIGGVNEWMARMPGAILTALSVPLLYGVGRELFPRRVPAVLAALVYLTFLPIVRHGRLAMLDGALVCFCLLMIYCLLRSRRDLRWGLGVGLGFGLMCLTKGAIGILLGAIGILFILWDTPRLLTSGYLWTGMVLGSAPVIAWYWAQWVKYGPSFLGINLVSQSFSRLWSPVEGNSGPIWYYLWELIKFTLPWLVFLPQGFKLAWENRNLGWAKLVLVWSGLYFLVISLMQTKLPWYLIPLYPPLALVAGAMLAEIWEPADVLGVRRSPRRRYPIAWVGIFGTLAIAGWGLSLYFSQFAVKPLPGLPLLLVAIALTFTAVTILLIQRDSQFVLVLFWGTYVSLLMLMMSSFWVWELQESYPVKPVADLIRRNTPTGTVVVTSYPNSRPSLNFYGDRWVVPVTSKDALARYWKEPAQPYLLTDLETLQQLSLASPRTLGAAEGLLLVTREPTPNSSDALKENSQKGGKVSP